MALAGCVGGGSGADTVASPSSEEATGSDGNAADAGASGSGTGPAENLTLEIVDWDAEWSPGRVEVTAWVNGSLTLDGDPASGRVGGFGNLTIPDSCWSDCAGDATGGPPTGESRRASYDASEAATAKEGNVTAKVGPVEFDGPVVPPAGEPHCEGVGIWIWGSVWDRNQTAWDADRVLTEICTQSYP